MTNIPAQRTIAGAILLVFALDAPQLIVQALQRTATPGQSTLGKELDRSHESVAAVFADRAGRSPATGTLIAPRVVVTAGHVSPRPAADLPAWIVSFGANVNTAAREVRLDPAHDSLPHPSFLSFVEANGRNPNERVDFLDVGLLFLPAAVTGITPMELPAPGALERRSARDQFIAVGYGYHEVIRESDAGVPSQSDGNRRRWRVGVTILNRAWMRLDDDPTKGYGQICRGDSGAPILLKRGNAEILVGVVSHSDGQGCGPGTPTYALRADNPAVLDWIRTEVERSR